MGHRKSLTLIVISCLLVIPLFCAAIDEHGAETEDSSSGEAEFPRPRERPGYGASPDEREEEEEISEGDDSATSEEEQSTPSSVAAVGTENNHLPREPDVEEPEEEEDEDEDEDDEGEDHESVELTTLLAVTSSSVPLAPIPPEEEEEDDDDVARDDGDSHQLPHNETLLIPEPSQTVIIWDGTGEPGREQPEQPTSQSDEKPASQPEVPASQPEQTVNQPNDKPHSQEQHGGANGNGNGQPKESGSEGAGKSSSHGKQEDRQGAKSVPVTSSGSTSSSMAWVVVFAVVSSALLISGMSDSESERDSSCHRGCRHNFTDFNPYAWPPTPVNRKEITLRPVT